MPAAEVQKDRVEPSATGERDGAQDRFRILLVADPAREHDEELVGRQVQAPPQARTLVRVSRTKLIDVHAVVQPDLAPRAPLGRDLAKVRSHREAASGESAVDGSPACE